ncbi:MAG TPA: glycosyltransferase family 39 protein [Chthoniobacterales bacterium]
MKRAGGKSARARDSAAAESGEARPRSQVSRETVALGGIFVLALVLRLWGLDFGLPLLSNFYVRPDESLIVTPAVRFFENSGDPEFYIYPALMMAACAVLFQVRFSVLDLFHLTQAPTLGFDFASNPSDYFFLARLLSAVFGALTVFIVYALARRLSSRFGALAAAVLFSVAPLAVRDAHFGVTDTLLTFLSAATLYAIVWYVEGAAAAGRQRIMIAAALLGLAISTKYTAFALLPLLAATILLKHYRRPTREALLETCLLVLIPATLFVVINPYLFIRPSSTNGLRWILGVIFRGEPGAADWTLASGLSQMIRPLRHGPGEVLGLVLCAIHLCWPGHERSSTIARFTLLAGAGAFLLPLVFARHSPPYRYVLPALPVIAVFAGKGLADIYFALSSGRARLLAFAALVYCAGDGLWTCYKMDRLLARDDTRTLAGRWLRDHVPMDVPVIILGGPEAEPQIRESAASIRRRIEYVKRLYGETSGDVVSQLYRLQLRMLETSGAKRPDGYEVFRNPQRSEFDAATVAVVRSTYPVALTSGVVAPPPLPEGEIIRRWGTEPLSRKEPARYEFDRSDAFFLPFNRFDEVKRPGPAIEIVLIKVRG